MSEELKQAAQQALEAYDAFADADDFSTLFELNRKMNVLRDLTQRPAAQAGEREAWVPYLVDRADGVKGHYAIGRWNPRGYREVWNLHSHRWAAYSDDVMSLEEADSLLRQITIPTVPASLPTQPAAQATPEPVFVIEVRECPDCGHIGINEWHPTDSACSHCDWTGPSPQEDKCPGCGTVGSMSSACPECGHKDTLIAHKHLPIPAATPPQQAAGEPVYQYQRGDGSWIDQTKASYDYNVKHGQATVRVLYATHPAPDYELIGFARQLGIRDAARTTHKETE